MITLKETFSTSSLNHVINKQEREHNQEHTKSKWARTVRN